MKIQDILNENGLNNLSDNQQGLLLSIYSAATPRQAFDTSTGAENGVTTRQMLAKMGLIQVGNNQIILTNNGKQMLFKNNLIDARGQITPYGLKSINGFDQNKTDFNT